MDKSEKDKAKNVRRGAKGSLTRTINATKELIEAHRSKQEVNESFEGVKRAHKVLLTRHEEYAVLLDDEEFQEAEMWMQTCTSEYVACSIQCHDYVNMKNDDKGIDNHNIVVNESSTVSDDASNVTEGSVELTKPSTSTQNESYPNETQSHKVTKSISSPKKSFTVKHEKAKLPIFSGNVRQYFIFKSDFKHAVEAQYSERNTLAVFKFRACQFN